MASTSGGASGAPAQRACESCNSAPAIPFCRVEWSYLCACCGPTVHRNSWIVAMPPFPPNPNANASQQFQYPGQGGGEVKRKRKRRSKEETAEVGSERVESVMRYKEKRKSRQLNKPSRSETGKVCPELRPRTEDKSSIGEEPKVDEMAELAFDVVDPVNESIDVELNAPVVEAAEEDQ